MLGGRLLYPLQKSNSNILAEAYGEANFNSTPEKSHMNKFFFNHFLGYDSFKTTFLWLLKVAISRIVPHSCVRTQENHSVFT